MKVAIALAVLGLAALAAASSPLQEQEYEFLFGRWVEQHGKVYESVDTFFKRYNVWKNNMNYVIAHANKNKTHSLAMNSFGDLTNAEFKSLYNNYQPRMKANRRRSIHRRAAALPASIDWRTKGAVTPIKNQGQCGSCWAFSTTGSVEGAVHKATGKLISLSEQQLVDCAGSTGNDGCNGGEMQDAMQWIINNGGICTEAAYPYTAQDGTCQTTCTIAAKIKSYVSVDPNDEDALAKAVAEVGPTSVAVDAGGMDWQFYSGGVLSDSGCGTQLDHGVLAVGYNTAGSQPYWIVKNSWGTSWGMQGYIEILKGTGSGQPGECGIAMDASYPIA